MHLVHASWILLRGGCTSANFCNDARSTPTRRARELHARSIVRHYVRVPFAVRAINESRLCFLTMNVSVVSESSGRPTRSMTGGGGEKGGDSADSKVGIIAIITAPLKQETARTISRWCSFTAGEMLGKVIIRNILSRLWSRKGRVLSLLSISVNSENGFSEST